MKTEISQFTPWIRPIYALNTTKTIMSSFIGPGKEVEKFELNILKTIEHSNEYCIATTSGTVALIMVIKALELKPGSTILFPAYTFLAGANAAKFLGYNIKLIDIDEDNLCMDPKLVEKELKEIKNMSAIIYVNHNAYDGGTELGDINDLCIDYNIKLIQDAAQCIDVPIHLYGEMATYSFSVPKIVTTAQGGAVVTKDENIYNKLKQIRDHGDDNWKKTKLHTNLGVNFKFNDILASFGNSQFNHFNEIIKNKDNIFEWYRNHIKIKDFFQERTWMVIYENSPIIINKVKEQLKLNNIGSEQYYKPIHWNPPYKTEDSFPIAEKMYERLLYLPSSLTLNKSDVDRICSIIKKVEIENG